MATSTGVKYIGKNAVYEDNILRTGLTWSKGEVHILPSVMAKEFLKHPTMFSEVPGATYLTATLSSGGVAILGPDGKPISRMATSQIHRNSGQRFGGVTWSDPSGRVVGDYQVIGAGSTAVMDSAIVRDGVTSTLKVTLNRGSAGATDLNILHSTSPVLVPSGRAGVWIYIPNYTLVSSIVLKVSFGDATYANGKYQTYNIAGDLDKQFSGWHFVAFDLAEYGGTWGTVDATTTTINAVKLTVTQAGATPAEINIGKWTVGWNTKARIMITSDDGYASWFRRAVPILDSLNLRSTASIIASQIDSNATWATSAELGASYDNGHDLCAHGSASLASLGTYDAVYADVKANMDFLFGKGWTRALSYYVYPNGVYQMSAGDQTIINALKALGVRMARGTVNPRHIKAPDGMSDARWNQPILGVGGTVATATLTGYIDSLIAYGGLGCLMYHDITNSGASSGTLTNVADFYTVMRYIADKVAAGLLVDVTASEVLATF